MNSPRDPDDNDLLAAYAAGNPEVVRAAAPPEPSRAEWESVRRNIHARLSRPPQPSSHRRVGLAFVGTAALIAAAVAWVFLSGVSQPASHTAPGIVGVVPLPVDAPTDPLAEFVVLPIAGAEDVVLCRVPGDGWLPVGTDPLPGVVALATTADVEVDDFEAWPDVAPAPGFAPMIFATKTR